VPKRRKPRELNALAASLVDEVARETAPPEPHRVKDPAAVALGRRGGLKGGKARAAKLTPAKRSDLARRAARARWDNR
jgi:hypothetical protein